MSLKIDPTAWPELSRLLDTALELPIGEREGWLEALDAMHDALKPQLRELLARARVETRDFLSTLPRIDAPTLAYGQNPGGASEVVGPYRLLRQIGSGGMGSVWLAERTDGLLKRPIALKLPHRTYDAARRSGLAERMAREREILANLNHPNIAMLYDAGIASDGQPFLAIEYVEGWPIDEYCRQQQATLRQRLDLFLQVARAVAYAHGKLALHRDLKPANILVTTSSQVRLLDFGIAKLMDGGQSSATPLTEVSGRALTPDYASPEQILGEPLSVASDVYSLGVVLYELLCEQRPFQIRADPRIALADAIAQTSAPLPSAIAAAPWRKSLRGDLDTIVLTALKKVPAERYATADALADDIMRYLGGRPVLARPDRFGYRLRKFVTRNLLPVSAATLVVLLVICGAGLALWQSRVALAERDRAEAVKSLVTSMFVAADHYANGGNTLTAVELLLQAEHNFRVRPAKDPRVRAEIAAVLAGSLFRLNADAAGERLTAQALADAERSLPVGDPSRLRLTLLAAEQQRFRGNAAAARSLVEVALGQLRISSQSLPQDFVLALLVKADIAIDAADYGTAVAVAREAVGSGQRLLPRRDGLNVRALSTLAQALLKADEPDAAASSAQSAVQLALEVFGPRSTDPLAMDARVAYAKALGATGHFAQAADVLEAVVREATVVHGAQSVEVGMYLQNAAGLQLRAGRIRQGIDSAARAVAIRGPAINDQSFESLATRGVYARALLLGERPRDALPILTTILPGIVNLLGPTHIRTLDTRAYHALALAQTGALNEAAALADGVIADADHAAIRSTHQPWHVRAVIANLQGDIRAAIALETTALTMESARRSAADQAAVLTGLGTAQIRSGEDAAAERNLLRALALLDECGHVATPVRASALAGLTQLRLAQGKASEALITARDAAAFWRTFDPDSRDAAEAGKWLRRAQQALGRRRQAALRQPACRLMAANRCP